MSKGWVSTRMVESRIDIFLPRNLESRYNCLIHSVVLPRTVFDDVLLVLLAPCLLVLRLYVL